VGESSNIFDKGSETSFEDAQYQPDPFHHFSLSQKIVNSQKIRICYQEITFFLKMSSPLFESVERLLCALMITQISLFSFRFGIRVYPQASVESEISGLLLEISIAI
jgi:hypothetical protein